MNSLGVSVLLKHYVTGFQDGSINPRPNWKIIRETPTTANIDSDQGLGIMATLEAMDIAINQTTKVGVGMVTVGNARYLGMAAYQAMKALDRDMIEVCMTSTPGPVPANNELPFVFDAATR